MAEQVPFINREEELAQLDALIREWGTRRVCCIHGLGGIGKTRVLQEIWGRYSFVPSFAPDGVEKKDITIALVQEFTASEWSKEFIAGARSMADELGVDLYETDARFDLDRMASDLESVILKSPNAIVIRLGTSEKLRAGIQRAIEQGIKVLTFDNYLPNVHGLTTSIVVDDTDERALSEMLAKDMNFRGKVAAVWVKSEAIQERRKNVLGRVLLQYPNLELVAEFGAIGENMAEDIYLKTKEILRDCPDLQAIWVTWDEFTKGVIRALIDEGRTDISVYSFDLCQSNIDLMLQPRSPWMATVAESPIEIGRIIVRLATQAAYGIEIEQYYPIPMRLITQEALRKAITSKHPLWSESDIGWTPWLQSLQAKGLPEERKRLLITDIVDFDDRTLHIPQNLGRRIVMALGEKAFEPYMRGLLDWRKMEMAGVSPEVLGQQSERVNQVFVDNFNEIASKSRVFLLLDTTDALEGTDVWSYIGNLALQMKNILFLIAGRNAKTLWEELESKIGEDARLIELPPLETEASEQYLQKKQELLHVTLAPEIAQKLLLLARGRPILIDLAVEWTAREIPLDWLVEESLTQLEGLSDEEMEERQKEFEYQLVRHIADIRTQMDRLILALSHVYPLDREMIVELLGLSEDEAEELLEEAQTYVFVKSLPDERISLHDEMRRMVNVHVWPKVDPDGDRQRRDSKRAVAYLERKLKTFREQIEQLEGIEKAAREKQDAKQELEAFLEREALERELWVLEGQRLRHILLVDLAEGVKAFAEMFDEATRAYRFLFRETLLAQMEQYVERLSPEQMYELDSRQAKYLLDRGQYPQARELVTEILDREGLSPERQIDMLIQLANIKIRLGDFRGGIAEFEKAVKISRQPGLEHWLNRALTGLGWGYRLVGRLDEATRHYREALELSIELGDDKRQAMLLNNLAFVFAYQGRYRAALSLCEQASAIWHKLEEDRGLGALYVVYREVYRRREMYDQALKYTQLALDIFEPQNDAEWLSQVYGGFGAIRVLQSNPQAGEKDLRKALDLAIAKDKAWILHWMGRAVLDQGRIDEAAEFFQRGYTASKELPDTRYQLFCLWGLAWTDALKEDYERLGWFMEQYQEYKEQWPDVFYPSAEGLLLKSLGDLALGEAPPESIKQATEYYQQALPLVAEHITYGPFKLQSQLADIEKRLKEFDVKPEAIQELGTTFYTMWKEKELHVTHPEALPFFLRWKKGESSND